MMMCHVFYFAYNPGYWSYLVLFFFVINGGPG